ncbi:MAG: YceD family protein [Roseiflexaceae bacterium]|jgi:uncharacterized protein|nr:DUF177 domain-containing protein [Chloroflexaceae bacterium]MCE2852594.1 DUF177 domain-containing protein [Chloroflexaceae bacterium]
MKRKDRSPLTFNVAQLLREPIGARRQHDFTEDSLQLYDNEFIRDIHGHVHFTRTLAGVYVKCRAVGNVTTQCVRCLQPAHVRVELDFVEECIATVDVNTGAALPKPEEDDVFLIDEHHMLDVGVAIREYALLEIPISPHCKDDCRGLCTGCGVDLNLEVCRCHEESNDERFAALRALLNKTSTNESRME